MTGETKSDVFIFLNYDVFCSLQLTNKIDERMRVVIHISSVNMFMNNNISVGN